MRIAQLGLLIAALFCSHSLDSFGADPSYIREVQPLLRKYCGGCHNEADKEGDFSVASYEALLKGTPDKKVVVPGKSAASLIIQLIDHSAEPQMPPEDEAQPSAKELALLKTWIDAGAKNDADMVPLSEQVKGPELAADADAASYVTYLTDAGEKLIAVARLNSCEIRDPLTNQVLFSINDIPGKINQLRTSSDQNYLVIACGIAGVGGQAIIVDLKERKVAGRVQGHTDTLYCACLSPDNKFLATGSYDRQALLWDWREKKIVQSYRGHNGAIYDLDIDRENKVLATASADQTIKLWGLQSGARLDTLGQPEGEMLCVRFTPDGRFVLGSGADRQIRRWEIISKDRPAINPMRDARYAHEEAVTQLVFRDDEQLLSLSEDRTIKLWTLKDLMPLGQVTQCKDIPTGVGKSHMKSRQFLIADYSGTFSAVSVPTKVDASPSATSTIPKASLKTFAAANDEADKGKGKEKDQDKTSETKKELAEVEPNNRPQEAQAITLPAVLNGKIASEADGRSDVDFFAFDAKAGEPWIIEIKAARDKSPLDSVVDVLDDQGRAVLRTRLQAIRESYFTFRGKDSNTSDDFRMHKWQEMELNQYLYANGEVVKLWLYPRGPDSGFKVYPGFGNRATYFDTTPTSHALGEIAYIVRELQRDETPLPNGLPVFPVYFQNDDDGKREWGKDSHLSFTAPSDGRYVVRVRDARGFGGDDFKYELKLRPARPDFSIEVKQTNLAMSKGSGREWQVIAKRLDGLEGPIEIHLDGVPKGFEATNPLIIEAGQSMALGNLFATANAQLPEGEEKISIKLTASSLSTRGIVTHEIETPLTVQLQDKRDVELKLVDIKDSSKELDELVIHPGEVISARVIVERNEHKGPVSFGKDDAGRNLPHGSFVDNIGLNGLLITDQASEREFFIRAADWLEPQERLFHLRSETKNNPTSRSIRLRVVPK